jgi:hypothetical protein
MKFLTESIDTETDPAKLKAIEIEGSMIAKKALAKYEKMVAQRSKESEKEEEDGL